MMLVIKVTTHLPLYNSLHFVGDVQAQYFKMHGNKKHISVQVRLQFKLLNIKENVNNSSFPKSLLKHVLH